MLDEILIRDHHSIIFKVQYLVFFVQELNLSFSLSFSTAVTSILVVFN